MTNQMTAQPCGTESAAEDRGEPSPFIYEFFMVQCVNFKCMAYRDQDGKWRGALDNEELDGFVRVLE